MKLTLLSSSSGLSRVRCEGQFTFSDIDGTPNPLEKLLGSDCYAGKVLVSLEATEFIDSAGIGWLVMAHRKFTDAGGRLVLHSLPPMIAQVFRLLHMPSLLHLADTEDAARALATADKP